jgi:hypothetical protein
MNSKSPILFRYYIAKYVFGNPEASEIIMYSISLFLPRFLLFGLLGKAKWEEPLPDWIVGTGVGLLYLIE